MCFRIKIHYKFHPYSGEELEVVSKPRERSGAFTVIDREGKSLKIPFWMTEEQSTSYKISDIAQINIESLLILQSLLDLKCNSDCT